MFLTQWNPFNTQQLVAYSRFLCIVRSGLEDEVLLWAQTSTDVEFFENFTPAE